jgi:DeoR/GlpR family transcriptional regulator of sugar metabolism
VLADHSKIGVTTFAHICGLKEVSTLITNGECPADIQQALKENRVKLLSSTYADQDPV